MKKRIIPLLLCLVMALSVLFALPANADAATAQETGNAILEEALAMEGSFPEDGTDYPARCPACNKDVTWKALTTKYTSTGEANAHFYLASDTKYTGQFIEVAQAQGTFCLHTNGHTNTGNRRFINAKTGTVVNIMGSGTLKGDPQQYRATLLANTGGTINIYGTTIESTATATSIYDDSAICAYNASATINVWGSNLISGVTPVISTNGTVNLYNCTATGAAAKVSGHGNTVSTSAKLNLVDSSVSGVVVNAGAVTVSGATVINGTGLELPEGTLIDPTGLTEGASIAVASEGAFTASGMTAYAQYFTSADKNLTFAAKTDGTLANLDEQAYAQEVIEKAKALESKFPTSGNYSDYCPVCNISVNWKPLTTNKSTNTTSGDHYYIPADFSNPYQIFLIQNNKKICVHTNGKTLTGTGRFAMVSDGCELNVMGSGTLTSSLTSTTLGVLYVNGAGTINVYGTTVVSTSTAGHAALQIYKANGVINAYGATLTAANSPTVITNGVVNLYNCTATGQAAQIGGAAGDNGANAALNLVNTTITGVNFPTGSLTVSGATKITVPGLTVAAGKTIDPSKLTGGASIAIASEGAFTGAKMADYAKYFSAVSTSCEITAGSNGVLRCWEPGALLVSADGSEDVADDLLTAWATGEYSHIKLYGDDSLAMDGESILIDLAGYDLSVSGSGNISVFDTANDTYDPNACGVIVSSGEVTFAESVAAPNGNRYIAVTNGNQTTAHRLSMKLTSVSLRPAAAGLYYKAQYDCDSVLAKAVKSYGVVVSVHNMPGDDFVTEEKEGNYNAWTVGAAPFESGIIATSGSIFGIMKDSRTAELNDQYAKVPIYANAYISLGGNPIVADIANPGKQTTDGDFTGVALSLYDVMFKLDDNYTNYNSATCLQLDNFYFKWKDLGMDWGFAYIGQTADATNAVDNSNLSFDEGTTDAMCPVCKEKVTWTELTVAETHQNLQGHYYLSKDLTFENTGDAFFYNSASGKTLCVHLNGHNLTATQTRVVHGSSGRVNIMGNGIVTGYQKTKELGAAVMVNNTVASQSVHLYGGTYRKTEDSHSAASPLCINVAGGELCVYQGAKVENADGVAILVKTATNASARKMKLDLYGCTVDGDVILNGSNASLNSAQASTDLIGCVINGNVQVAEHNDVCLSGAPVITSVTLLDEALLNIKELAEGTSVGIASEGVFTPKGGSLKKYISYFYGTNPAAVISVRDSALHCGPDYTGKLQFAEGTTDAMCPACGEVVTWKLADGTAMISMQDGDHYYLAEDVTFTASASELSFLGAPGSNKTACFHLNGHNITATNTRVIYGSAGVLNVMGSGVASGLRGDKNASGGVVQINTSVAAGTVNLYGGTWKHLEGGSYCATDYVISISNNGGCINVHEGATVEANTNGNAVYVGTSSLTHSNFGLYGGTVKGKVYAAGANQSNGFTSNITVDGGTVEGTVDIDGVNTVTLSHAAKIQLLDLEETTLVTLGAMTVGADITVCNEGVFTQPSSNARSYLGYFKPAIEYDMIQVQENALRYRVNYEGKIYPDAEGKAYCPVCKEVVEWTPVSSGESSLTAAAGEHYYLTDDILYEGAYDGNGAVSFLYGGKNRNTASCFHLNGHDITSTKSHGIFGGYGILNIMGEGIVTGYARAANYGGAVQVNNSVVGNCVNLYSGTYKNAADSVANTGAVAIAAVGGKVCIYEDASVQNSGGTAIYLNVSNSLDTKLEIYGATVQGGISTKEPSKKNGDYKTVIIMDDVTITGEVNVALGNEATFNGRTKIGKLTVSAGQTVTFTNLLDGSAIAVSADGIFTPYMELADEWLNYITCADAGDWIIVRDKTFYQEVKQEITAAADDDKTALDTAYADKVVRYGEMHNHSNSGPRGEYNTGADGNYSLAQWKAEMDRLNMDFATIVDHGQSIHMYYDDWDPTYFVGGTEPGTTITDSKASNKSPHYNMIFSDPAKLEALAFSWETKFKPVKWEGYEDGYRFKYPTFKTAEFAQLAQDVYAGGGLLVHVHPKYDSYIYSSDPLDYYFADYTGLEICTGSTQSGVKSHYMTYKDNEEAYQLWVDLLELGKKIFATSGSDRHRLPDISGLTTMYTDLDHCDTYLEHMRTGNFAPGWIGIRMNVNGTAMGGETDFTGKRLQFSVGDIYTCENTDYVGSEPIYVKGHTYRVELYDDGGLLMSSTIDPTELNYFAIDCDATAKFYRVVVWDETDNERIGVGNPIWNTAEN